MEIISKNGTKTIFFPWVFRPLQIEILKNIGRFGIVLAHRRFGKQNPITSIIPMADGTFKQLGDIIEGDQVIDNFGNPTTVLHAHPINLSPESYEIILENGDKVGACAEHQWYVEPSYSKVTVRKNRKPWVCGKVVNTRELKTMVESDSWFIPCTEPVKYSKKDLLIEPYLLGLWLGDGSSDDFRICSIDDEIHNHIKQFSILDNPIYINPTGLRYSKIGTSKSLKEIGVYKNKHVPINYKTSTIEDRIALIQGLMDTDGHIPKEGKGRSSSCKFFNNNLTLIKDVKQVLQSLGVKVSLKTYYPKDKNPEHVLMFSPWFNPFKLERKAKLWVKNTPRASRLKIKSIKRIDSVPMRCLTVDSPMNLFLITENYIPTHNTLMFLLHMVMCALHSKNKMPKYAYIFPEKEQAKRIAWQYLKAFAPYLPNAETKENELVLHFDTGDGMGMRTIQLLGADNKGQSLRGLYLDGAVLDEVKDMPPEVWTDVVRPMLSDRKGWGYLTGTYGHGYFGDLINEHENNPESEFKVFDYNVTQTGIIDEAEQASLKATMTEESWQREYMNNRHAISDGSYFGDTLVAHEKKGVISNDITPLPQRPVVCSWDLGATDMTSVWFFQVQDDMSYRFLDYLQMNRHMIRHVKEPESFDLMVYKEVIKKGYHVAAHILPWDSKHKHISAQYSTYEKFKELAGQAKIIVADKIPLDIGIATTQSMVAQACFHKSNCAKGLSALSVYSSTSPKWCSHAADAIRYAAVAARHLVGELRYKLQNIKKVNQTVQTVSTYDPL